MSPSDEVLEVDITAYTAPTAAISLQGGPDHKNDEDDPMDMSLAPGSVQPSFNTPQEDLPSPLSVPRGAVEMFRMSSINKELKVGVEPMITKSAPCEVEDSNLIAELQGKCLRHDLDSCYGAIQLGETYQELMGMYSVTAVLLQLFILVVTRTEAMLWPFFQFATGNTVLLLPWDPGLPLSGMDFLFSTLVSVSGLALRLGSSSVVTCLQGKSISELSSCSFVVELIKRQMIALEELPWPPPVWLNLNIFTAWDRSFMESLISCVDNTTLNMYPSCYAGRQMDISSMQDLIGSCFNGYLNPWGFELLQWEIAWPVDMECSASLTTVSYETYPVLDSSWERPLLVTTVYYDQPPANLPDKMQHWMMLEKLKTGLFLELHLLVLVVMRREAVLWPVYQSARCDTVLLVPWDPGVLMNGMCANFHGLLPTCSFYQGTQLTCNFGHDLQVYICLYLDSDENQRFHSWLEQLLFGPDSSLDVMFDRLIAELCLKLISTIHGALFQDLITTGTLLEKMQLMRMTVLWQVERDQIATEGAIYPGCQLFECHITCWDIISTADSMPTIKHVSTMGVNWNNAQASFLHLTWDPGGYMKNRLEGKPKFKKGGLSATSFLLGLARTWAVICWALACPKATEATRGSLYKYERTDNKERGLEQNGNGRPRPEGEDRLGFIFFLRISQFPSACPEIPL